jgi:lysophospholipase L1-like esterase
VVRASRLHIPRFTAPEQFKKEQVASHAPVVRASRLHSHGSWSPGVAAEAKGSSPARPRSHRPHRLIRALVTLTLAGRALGQPVELTLTGDWTLTAELPGGSAVRQAVLQIPPVPLVTIRAERHDALPLFNPSAGGWVKGAQLRAVRAQETTTPFLLDPDSLELRDGANATARVWRAGDDYLADLVWGTVGRIAEQGIPEGQPVFASYRYAPLRLDAIVLTRAGEIELRRGEPRSAAPTLPALAPGERHLASVWLPGRLTRLAPQHLFPVLEPAYPEPPKPSPAVAERLLPNFLRKLRSGEPVRILAWGDSVTDGSYLADPGRERWQEQFVTRLRQHYPKAPIELLTEAWGGRNTASYVAEPPGSPHNYREQVLGAKPDLVISEFVNDAWLNPIQVEEHYGRFLADFRRQGAEWIILTPHYVRPDWMGLDRERDIDDDPRPYVAGLREFAARHGVALADAARRYGRLWRQGIPYTTLLLNSINHPDARGMGLFVDALFELFPSSGVSQ